MVGRNAAPKPVEMDRASVPTPRFDADLAKREWRFKYDPEFDILRIVIDAARPAISVDVNGEMWLRLDPSTGQILGFEIEDFLTKFVPTHPELPPFALTDRERIQEHKVEKRIAGEREGVMHALIEFIRRVCGVGDGPSHGQFLPA
jgi:uncharacterized protein YuzE